MRLALRTWLGGCVWLKRGLVLAVLGALNAGCLADKATPEERGEALFLSPELSPSQLNLYSCATCHGLTPSDHERFTLPGAWLGGATQRQSFWGGHENDLLASVNACRAAFQVAPQPLAPEQDESKYLYSYLDSLEPKFAEPVEFTVQSEIQALPRGAEEAGEDAYVAACAYCHGEMHTGRGRLSPRVPTLPENTIAAHPGYSPRVLRLVFLEKVRHGAFLGYAGDMPPFSLEVLSDEKLADILEELGITGE